MARYHVTKRDNNQYEVKLENCERVSKLCNTQKEAIETASRYLGNKNEDGCVLVHRVRNTESGSKGQVR